MSQIQELLLSLPLTLQGFFFIFTNFPGNNQKNCRNKIKNEIIILILTDDSQPRDFSLQTNGWMFLVLNELLLPDYKRKPN